MQKCLKEIALDVEYAIINSSAKATAGSATEGVMGGIAYFNTTNVKSNGGTPRAITEELINDALQLAWDDGGKPDWLITSGKTKRVINGFTGMALRTRSMDEEKIKNMVSIFESDFGTVNIQIHRLQANTRVDALQADMWKTAYLKPFSTREMPQTSLKIGKVVVGQLTLECRHKDANAAITDLTA